VKIFFDMEFTGLHQNTTPISFGAITNDDRTFYMEFTDYDYSQVSLWVKDNVISNLEYKDDKRQRFWDIKSKTYTAKARRHKFAELFNEFIDTYDKVEMWSDCLAYDWVLFNQFFGGALKVPEKIYYIPFDICTVMKIRGIDPDINREKFAEMQGVKHNALHDAKVIRECYRKLCTI